MIEFRDGDLLRQPDVNIIAHQVNCKGAMNSGIAKQIRIEYKDNFINYKHYCAINKCDVDKIGGTILVTDTPNKPTIANLFSQGNYGYDGSLYTNYYYFRTCMIQLYEYAKNKNKTTIGIPYMIGCCRGGGSWDIVFNIISEVFATDPTINLIICKYDKG